MGKICLQFSQPDLDLKIRDWMKVQKNDLTDKEIKLDLENQKIIEELLLNEFSQSSLRFNEEKYGSFSLNSFAFELCSFGLECNTDHLIPV